MPKGPETMEALFDYPKTNMRRLIDTGDGANDEYRIAALKKNLGAGVKVVGDYSGVEFPKEALRLINVVAPEELGLDEQLGQLCVGYSAFPS